MGCYVGMQDKSSRKLEGVVTNMQHQVTRLNEDFSQLKNSSSLSQQVTIFYSHSRLAVGYVCIAVK